MTEPTIDMLRSKLAECDTGKEVDTAFLQLEAKILLLVDTIESAHSVRLEELRQEAGRLASARASGSI